MELTLIFPNQLFENSELIQSSEKIILLEEFLFFKNFNFHKQKILFHRMSMKFYENYLKEKCSIKYVDSTQADSDVRVLIKNLNNDIHKICIYDPNDNWLHKRIKTACAKRNIELVVFKNPLFLLDKAELNPFFRGDKKKFFQTSFYKNQRQEMNLLMQHGLPEGGEWTYDKYNREKYPKGKQTPIVKQPIESQYFKEALTYVEKNFKNNCGELPKKPEYPHDFTSSKKWFTDFLKIRFNEFGAYEDAVLKDESKLHHSLLSPLMNVGLIDPNYIVQTSVKHARKHNIPINSTEGFIRQIIGWREFIRGVYIAKGTEERTKNFWNFSRKMPAAFYNGTTGIEPFDDSVKKIIKTGYINHIERLMIVGNLMLLCEIDPDEVYRWFMELSIDSYDWVMVPNVYGMSQFADGGLMSTKPYISGSSYVLKMSDYKKGEWCPIWDALFWNFINNHKEFFKKNPRMRMLVSSFEKMSPEKKKSLLETSASFIAKLK